MKALSQVENKSLQLVDIIDFKWLMAHDGVRIHVEKLQSDRVYALDVLTTAARSPHEALRLAAKRLQRQLGLDDLPSGGLA